MPDHHVEQQVLHLKDRAVAGRAVRVDRLGEEQRRRHPVFPGPGVGILGIELLAEILLGNLAVFRLPVRVGQQLLDEIAAVVHEVQRQVGRDAELLAVILHGRQHLLWEGRLGSVRQGDRVHERRVAAEGIGGEKVDVEVGRTGGEVGSQLVEEAITVEEDQLHLVGIGRGGVIGIGRLAKTGLLRPARPPEHGHLGHGSGHAQRREQGGTGQKGSQSRHFVSPWIL